MSESTLMNILNPLNELNSQIIVEDISHAVRKELRKERPLNLIVVDSHNRLFKNTTAIYKLFKSIEHESGFNSIEHPLGIIIRSGLQDSLRIFYVIHMLDIEEAYSKPHEHERIANKILADQIQHLIREIDNFGNAFQKLKERSTNLKENLKREFSELIAVKNPAKTAKMFKSLKTNERFTEDSPVFYNLWMLYSKYEHYGPLNATLDQASFREKISNILQALLTFTHAIAYVYSSYESHKNKVEDLKGTMDSFGGLLKEVNRSSNS